MPKVLERDQRYCIRQTSCHNIPSTLLELRLALSSSFAATSFLRLYSERQQTTVYDMTSVYNSDRPDAFFSVIFLRLFYMAPTVHLIRHGEGYHNIPPESLHKDIHDADLTPAGAAACRAFAAALPTQLQHVELVCASPLKRALNTALLALSPLLGSGRQLLALPDAQEANSDPSNTGSPLADLQAISEFQGRVDWTLVEAAPYWYRNVGVYDDRRGTVEERARRLRRWLKARPEKEIVVVGHGMFWHFVTGNIEGTEGHEQTGKDDGPDIWAGQQTGTYWQNLMWRSFEFEDDADDTDASLVETRQSRERLAQSATQQE